MRRVVPIVAALMLAAAACSGGSGDETTTTSTVPDTTSTVPATTLPPPTSAPTTTTSTSTTTTTVAIENAWPLTGEEGFVEGTPVVFVKIDNSARGRPQTGLEAADLVFEIVVEGGVPRLLAGFQSELPDVIGPVRSTRETDAKLLWPFAPYFAHSGGQSFVREMVSQVSRVISHPDLGNRAYFRARNRPSVYDLMLEPQEALARRGALARGNAVVLEFGEPAEEGVPATTVAVSLSNAQVSNWEWSEDDGVYYRSNSATPHLAESGDQISAANVIVLEVEQILLDRRDAAGSRVPDYQLSGSGPMVLFRDGLGYEGTWEREDFQRDWFRFVGADGAEIPLAVGSTWIELLPAGRSVIYN